MFVEIRRGGGAGRGQGFRAIANLVAGIGERAEQSLAGIEDRNRIAAIAAGDIALKVGRRIALGKDSVARSGPVFDVGGRREGADTKRPRAQAVIFDIDRLDMAGRLGAAAAAKIEIQIVAPVAEHLARQAQINAAEIGAAAEIGTVGIRQRSGAAALAVIAVVNLQQAAHRGGEASIGRGNLQAAIVHAGLVLAGGGGGDLAAEINILIGGAALQIGERGAGIAVGRGLGLVGFELLQLRVEIGDRLLQGVEARLGVILGRGNGAGRKRNDGGAGEKKPTKSYVHFWLSPAAAVRGSYNP